MRVGKVAGIQLILNNWFIALVLLFMLAGMGYKLLIVFCGVLWHELAHVLAASKLGLTVCELELLPFGGVARIERLSQASPGVEILVALAGPTASLVLAAAIYILMQYQTRWQEFLMFFFQINIMLALFNLLPCLPLDGGRITRAWLSKYFTYEQATRYVVNLSKVICFIFIIVTIYDFSRLKTINLTLVVAAFFIYATANSEIKVAGFRALRVLVQKKSQLSMLGVMPATHYTIMDNVRVKDIIKLIRPDQYYILIVLDTAFRIRGTISESQLWDKLPDLGVNAPIGRFI